MTVVPSRSQSFPGTSGTVVPVPPSKGNGTAQAPDRSNQSETRERLGGALPSTARAEVENVPSVDDIRATDAEATPENAPMNAEETAAEADPIAHGLPIDAPSGELRAVGPDTARACGACGAPVAVEAARCPACGAFLPGNSAAYKHGARRRLARPEMLARIEAGIAAFRDSYALPVDGALPALLRTKIRDFATVDVLLEDCVVALGSTGEGTSITAKGSVRAVSRQMVDLLGIKSRLAADLAELLPQVQPQARTVMFGGRYRTEFEGVPAFGLTLLHRALAALKGCGSDTSEAGLLAAVLVGLDAERAELERRTHAAVVAAERKAAQASAPVVAPVVEAPVPRRPREKVQAIPAAPTLTSEQHAALLARQTRQEGE